MAREGFITLGEAHCIEELAGGLFWRPPRFGRPWRSSCSHGRGCESSPAVFGSAYRDLASVMNDSAPVNLNIPALVAAVTLMVSYGASIGVIYLRAFWLSFGIDPFQFATASDLALVGLTCVGATLMFAAVAALLGSWLGHLAAKASKTYPRLSITVFFVIAVLAAALVLWKISALWLVAGVVGTWLLMRLVHQAPDVPTSIKGSKLLPYIVLATVYMPMAANYLAAHAAAKVRDPSHGLQVSTQRSDLPASLSSPSKLIGRISNNYFLYEIATRSVAIIPADSEYNVVLQPIPKDQPQKEERAQ